MANCLHQQAVSLWVVRHEAYGTLTERSHSPLYLIGSSCSDGFCYPDTEKRYTRLLNLPSVTCTLVPFQSLDLTRLNNTEPLEASFELLRALASDACRLGSNLVPGGQRQSHQHGSVGDLLVI